MQNRDDIAQTLALEKPPLFLDSVRYYLSKFNDYRLFLVQSQMVTSAVLRKTFLPKYFGLFGLLYGIRLAIDLKSFLSEVFAPDEDGVSLRSVSNHFNHALQDKERLSRMANDCVWFSLNLACFIVNPVLSVWLTVLGYSFDVIHYSYEIIRDCVTENAKTASNPYAQHHPHQLKNHMYDLFLLVDLSIGGCLCMFPPTALVGGLILTTGLALVAKKMVSQWWDAIAEWHHTGKQPNAAQTAIKNSAMTSSTKRVLAHSLSLNTLEEKREKLETGDLTMKESAPKNLHYAKPQASIFSYLNVFCIFSGRRTHNITVQNDRLDPQTSLSM